MLHNKEIMYWVHDQKVKVNFGDDFVMKPKGTKSTNNQIIINYLMVTKNNNIIINKSYNCMKQLLLK